MTEIVMIHDLVNPETGKTIKQENLEKPHNIPIGSLVEVEWDQWFGDGAYWKMHARLWVVKHDRDCDGTPLYSISRWDAPEFALLPSNAFHGFPEKSLTVVELTDAVRRGDDLDLENA